MAMRYQTRLLHEGENFTSSCRVSVSLKANANAAFLKEWKVSVVVATHYFMISSGLRLGI